MKKKIIALSIAFVLIVGAAIGTTLAYLTDNAGNVTNNFTVGNIKIDAVEYVNHTNAQNVDKDPEGTKDSEGNIIDPEETEAPYTGYKKIDLATGNSASYNYKNVLPGDNLYKKVVISNDTANNSNPAIFAVTVTETLPDGALAADAAWSLTGDISKATMPALDSAEVVLLGVDKTTEGTYVFYYFMPVTATQEIDLSAVVPEDLNSTALQAYNGKTIVVSVAAIQAEGFSTPAEAIDALEEAMA